jgi:hypothetical protein
MTQPAKGVNEVKVSKEIWQKIEKLDKEHKYWHWIDGMKEALLFNRLCGDSITKKRIPNYYKNLYGVNNLYRYEHPEGYRSCYTLLGDGFGNINAHILDLMTHPEYEDRFGYKM